MRITNKVLDEKVETLKTVAEEAGAKYVDYGKNYTYAGLRSGDYGIVSVDPSNGSQHVLMQGSNRERYEFLRGMIFALQALVRFNA